MVRIEYKLGKTLLVFAFFGVCALLFAWIFVSPENFTHIRKARWLTSGFGRWVILPVFLASTGFLALRAAMLAVVDRVAVEITSTHLTLNGLWGRKHVRWSDVRGVELESNTGQAQLAVLTRSGGDFLGNGKIRVPVRLAGLGDLQLLELVDAIENRCKSPAVEQAHRVDELSAPAPAVAVRPSFGRKQV